MVVEKVESEREYLRERDSRQCKREWERRDRGDGSVCDKSKE